MNDDIIDTSCCSFLIDIEVVDGESVRFRFADVGKRFFFGVVSPEDGDGCF